MNKLSITLISTAALLFGSIGLADDQDALLKRGGSVVTHGEFDARVSSIPQRDRLGFIRDGSKVDRMLSQMMTFQMLADAAIEAGLDKDPLIQERMRLAGLRELGQAWLDQYVANAPTADFEQLAKETYLKNRDRFKLSDAVDVTHLLIKNDNRADEEARAKAQSLLDQVRAGTSFDELVVEHSEDPGVASNNGQYSVERGKMVKPFEEAAYALAEIGQFSDLVKTEFGYHIIRLDGKRPGRQLSFEEVKPRLVNAEVQKHQNRVRSDYLSKLHDPPLEIPDGAIEKMLKRYFGENLENAPDYDGNIGSNSP